VAGICPDPLRHLIRVPPIPIAGMGELTTKGREKGKGTGILLRGTEGRREGKGIPPESR